jgi:hypothetical protein
MKSLIAQSQEKVRLKEFAENPDSLLPRDIYIRQFNEIGILHEKGSPWNIWRIKE